MKGLSVESCWFQHSCAFKHHLQQHQADEAKVHQSRTNIQFVQLAAKVSFLFIQYKHKGSGWHVQTSTTTPMRQTGM